MKKENQEIREKEMKKFKVEKPVDAADNQILDDFNDELEAMRGQDSDGDEMGGLIDAAGSEYRNVKAANNEPVTPRLGLFLPQMSSEKKERESEELAKPEEEPE